jgi:putative chitobiose transport system permease protein
MFKYYGKTAPYLFLLPAALVLIVFFFIPFFQTILLSFQDYSTNIYHATFTGLKNYIDILHNPIFYKVMWNTILYLIVAVPILAIVPLFLAILINQKIRGITLYKILIYLPVIVSIVVAAIAFKWLYAEQGILNYILNVFHINSIGWLTDPKYAIYSVIIVTIWKGIGYYMMIYLASLMSVPKELYEACDIDGAGFLRKHLTVTIPHIMPTIALVTTISSISAMKNLLLS